jgi:hypothetical protein
MKRITLARSIFSSALLLIVAFLAYRFAPMIVPLGHGAVFGAASLLGGVLVAFGIYVFSVLDQVLRDGERFDIRRTNQVYDYIRPLRRRLALWGTASLIGTVTCGAIAYYLTQTRQISTGMTILGYVSLGVVALATMNTVSTYLGLDKFRLDLFRNLTAERDRLRSLRKTRPPMMAKPPGGVRAP